MHLELDELLAAHKRANNRMIGIEDLDEQELQRVAASTRAWQNARRHAAWPTRPRRK